MNYSKLLEGKKCVVTSGAHGLGFAISKLFAQHGASVAICGKSPTGTNSEAILREIAPESFFFRCDMADPGNTEKFAEEVLSRFGNVDVLVNTVGINIREPVKDLTFKAFDTVQNVNLKSSLVLIRAFLPSMMENSGSIVNISSINSLAPAPNIASYCASKGAINSLSREIAIEYGKYGIRSNVLCPGWIATTIIGKDLENRKTDEGRFEELEKYNGSAPLISPARSWDIANCALFLASDMSSYITGCTIRCDGGATLQAHGCVFAEPSDAQEMRRVFYKTIIDDMEAQPK